MSGQGEELLAGYYDVSKRQKEVSDKKIKILGLKGTWDFDAPEDLIVLAAPPETTSQKIAKAQTTYGELESRINKFANPGEHFTKEYERLRQQCAKLQRKLDEVTRRFNTEQVDEKLVCLMLCGVESMMQSLKQHVHTSGELCQNGCHISKEVVLK